MMSSLTTTPSNRIDHRTVYKNLQTEANKSNNCTADSHVLNPINNKAIVSYYTYSKLTAHSTTPPYLFIITPRTYLQQRSELENLAPKTKIPYPLATLWFKQKSNYFKRSTSLRVRGTKSNLPLIMEPTIDEITPTSSPTKNSTAVNEEKTPENDSDRRELALNSQVDTHVTESTTVDKIPTPTKNSKAINDEQSKETTIQNVSTGARRKLPLNSNTDANVTEPTTSQSLRRSFLVSPRNYYTLNSETDSSKNKECDVIKAKSKGAIPKVYKRNSNATEASRFNANMSLNLNGVTTLNETIITTANTTTTSPSAATITQQTRPLNLNTSTTASKPSTSKGLKPSPKTPQASSIQTTPQITPNSVIQTQYQTPTQSRTSPAHKLTPKTPPVTPDSPTTYLDDDLASVYSCGTTTSGRSTMSREHPYVARNGTTFSGRTNQYVFHCSPHAAQVGSDYLTPTQRAQKELRELRHALIRARQDLKQKDSEIFQLTQEVLQLSLFKASLSSPEERSASSEAVTVREAELKTSQDVSPIVDMVDDAQRSSSPPNHAHQQYLPQSSLQQHHMLSSDMQSSYADSGHFEDMTSSSVHSKDSSSYTSSHANMHNQACGGSEQTNAMANSPAATEQYELEHQSLIRMYERRIEVLLRSQDSVTSEVQRSNCDRIEALLQKLAECNTRYADLVPDYENAKERIRELEKQLEELQRRLDEQDEKQKQMYLHMYQQGQEAERIARADQALELAHRAPQNKVSVNELLHQLQSTQDELDNLRAAECRNECGNNHALLTAKEAISLWVLGARKTIYRRLLEAQKNRTHVDPEVTLQFLRSAVYYFLTDKENSQGHLQAIESILDFTEAEKETIKKARQGK